MGRSIEHELSKIEAKTESDAQHKRQRVMDRFLKNEDDKPSRGAFADPAAMF